MFWICFNNQSQLILWLRNIHIFFCLSTFYLNRVSTTYSSLPVFSNSRHLSIHLSFHTPHSEPSTVFLFSYICPPSYLTLLYNFIAVIICPYHLNLLILNFWCYFHTLGFFMYSWFKTDLISIIMSTYNIQKCNMWVIFKRVFNL